MRYLRVIWRMLPTKTRRLIFKFRFALTNNYKIYSPKYADDGLISEHIVDFMSDETFRQAYERGKNTGAIKSHPGDIHFRAYIACWAATHALNIEGDFVECGVGRGLLSKTIVEYVKFKEVSKKFFLIDTYQGIPIDQGTKSEIDSMEMLNTLHFNSSYLDEVRETFKEYNNVIVIPGKIPQVFSNYSFDKVSFLSIDMNNSLAESSSLDFFWEKLVPGAVVLFDDYAYGEQFRAQKNAIDKFVEHKQYSVLTLPTGQGMLIKK